MGIIINSVSVGSGNVVAVAADVGGSVRLFPAFHVISCGIVMRGGSGRTFGATVINGWTVDVGGGAGLTVLVGSWVG